MKAKKLSTIKQILMAMIIGMIAGLLLGDNAKYLKILGDIFLRLIQMSVVILIMGAVIESVGNLDTKDLGKLGVKMMFWFMITTILSGVIGVSLGSFLKPGSGITLEAKGAIVEQPVQELGQLIVDFFPTNVINSMASGNMIQVIVFAVLFGATLSTLREKKISNVILEWVKDLNVVIINMISKIMVIAPFGIGALLAYTTGTIGLSVILPLIKFLILLGIGTIIHLIITITFTAMYCKVSPLTIARKLTNMTMMAFTTTSSAVTLPIKMKDSEEKLGVSSRISNLVNPLAMTLNSNGLAMFLTLACITVAQIYNIEIGITDIIRIITLSTLACLGTVVVPGGGLVALTIVIPSIGLPLEGIVLLSGIDWFSGMFRTVLNVDIDALISMLIAKDVNELNYDILNKN
ncbi:dicarboxylate/amino acid:cation symporter [Tissierella sp.]|uniref:dicarboxylate/amino acid:cation symporter n=1 Tax=Tissierella sp. TaxID=41274 RepID=UPI0028582C41|nr:dicarboxylate/amino acid:cation symporter [Tissierella sp.]MDR7855287.1 dicarboxylate/amino acid:cation symporter [Tissierella sp.]